MAKSKRKPKIDAHLISALQKAYTARAKLFYEDERVTGIDRLIAEVAGLDRRSLDWNSQDLGISTAARSYLKRASIPLHRVFAHPDILSERKHLFDYYQNLAATSKKGVGQLLSGTTGEHRLLERCRLLNRITSSVIESVKNFALDHARDVMIAEVGSEVQGSWVNRIGAGAAKAVQDMLTSYARNKGYVQSVEKKKHTVRAGRSRKTVSETSLILTNGWQIVYSSEPDIAIYDPRGVLRSAIEVKGSMDKAGAQTRFGEAKKSFAKALRQNQRCETIYLASCFTDSLINHIQENGQVRKYYNLSEILTDARQRQEFLQEIFKFIIRIER